MLHGIIASPGIAIGKAFVLSPTLGAHASLPQLSIDEELKRFQQALEVAQVELGAIRDQVARTVGAEQAAILEAQRLMLMDPEMIEETVQFIRSQMSATLAWNTVTQKFIQIFETMKNEHMGARVADVKDIASRVHQHLQQVKNFDLSELTEEVIVVAEDLSPSETALLNTTKVLGFITNMGSKTSHSAILARTLGIPAVVGAKTMTQVIQNGVWIILNGQTGEILINPESAVIEKYRQLQQAEIHEKKELQKYLNRKSMTRDGHTIRLEANIGTLADLSLALKNDADGIGLFRTEFLYMDRQTMPTEEEQFQIYREVLSRMSPKSVIIRTLDIGGDKPISYLPMGKEMNPFLGCRAIRYCLRNPNILRIQLRALLRASVYGKLGIMFPMISSLQELLMAKQFVESAKKELALEHCSVSEEIQIGVMIEIPSAAMISDLLAKECDFFSIGTNDLIQYTCAVDRANEHISELYDASHLGVLRLIQMTITHAHQAGIEVSMCGEMASAFEYVPLLMGMGLDHLSMNANSILSIRQWIHGIHYADMKKLSQEIFHMARPLEIESQLKAFMQSVRSLKGLDR